MRGVLRPRHVGTYHRIPAAGKEPEAYAQAVRRQVSEHRYDLVLPFGLDAHHALINHGGALGAAAMLPSAEAFGVASDKGATAALRRRIGVPVPAVHEVRDRDHLRAIAPHLRYPVVVKARSGQGVRDLLRFVHAPHGLAAAWGAVRSTRGSAAADSSVPLVQEYIPGEIHDACTLSHHGRVIAMTTQVRRVMYPISGGVGAWNVTTAEPRLAGLARRVLAALEWCGPAQIEFRKKPRDGRYYLREVDPKLWGTLDLSLRVILVRLPLRDAYRGSAMQRYPAQVARVEALMAEVDPSLWRGSYDGATWGLDEDMFYDDGHPTGIGSRRLSEALGHRLTARVTTAE